MTQACHPTHLLQSKCSCTYSYQHQAHQSCASSIWRESLSKKKKKSIFFLVGLQNVIQLYKYIIDECENKVHQPSAKVFFLMLPTPPSPSTNSMLLMNWGMILGMRGMSRIKALNILAGETLVVISWVKVVTPMLEIVRQIFWCQGRKWIRLVEERVVEIRNNKLGIYRN